MAEVVEVRVQCSVYELQFFVGQFDRVHCVS
jgi:hypothetical protein